MRIIKSNKEGLYLEGHVSSSSSYDGTINIDTNASKGTIKGFGGAFTDSAASVFYSLPIEERERVLRLYFSNEGLAYNLGRFSIGSCDFSSFSYDYASKDDLSDFSLSHDEKEIIPFIKEAKKYAELELLASSWSPLAKWKSNDEKAHGGHLKEDCFSLYASYIARFVKEMEKEGLRINALTIQNEPEAVQVWESCIFSTEEERRFLMLLSSLLPDTSLFIHDHNRDHMVYRAKEILSDPAAYKAVKGIAYHWYDRDCFSSVSEAHRLFPDKELLFTEGCVETLASDYEGKNCFSSALRYAKNYISDMNNGTTGFIDWNLLLNENGGPNHAGNYCEAPIMKDGNRVRLSSSYYAIKHISSFAKKWSLILPLENTNKGLFASSVKDKDGRIILFLANEGERKNILVTSLETRAIIEIGKEEIMTLILN